MWPLIFLAAPIVCGSMLAQEIPIVMVFLAIFTLWVLWAVRLVRRRGPVDIPRAVVSLIAGMCLYDAMLIASLGSLQLAVLAVAGFALTLILQRWIPGT